VRHRGSGRLPSVRCSTSRSSEAFARSRVRSRASAPHPFARNGELPPVKGMSNRAGLPLAAVARLAAHLESSERKMLLSDFCNRHTTRAPVDRPIPGHEAFAVTDRQPRATASHPCGWSSALIRGAGAELPCGNAAPGRCALDGAHRASAPPLTALVSFPRRAELRSGRRSRATALSTARKVGDGCL